MSKSKQESKPKKQPAKQPKQSAKKPKAPKEIRQSVTQEILRSEITLNPYNPKRHSDKQIRQQVDNIKRNGYLGGIVWNRVSGNLIDGHRRVQALDIIHKYDGSKEKDYKLKVEVVEFDDTTEKEQMTYMAVGNSKADYNLIAPYMDEIDLSHVGLSDDDMKALVALHDEITLVADDEPSAQMADLGDDFLAPMPARQTPTFDLDKEEKSFDEIAQQRAEQPHESKEDIKAKKQHNNEIADRRNDDNTVYIMLKFDNVDDQLEFCDLTGYRFTSSMIIDGKELMQRLGM